MNNKRRIRVVSSLLRYCCIAGMIFTIPLAIIRWLWKGDQEKLLDKIPPLAVDLVPEILFLPIFFLLAKLLKRYEQSDFFSKIGGRYIRQIAFFLFFSQLASPLYTALSSYFLALPGPAIIALVLKSIEFKMIFLSFVIFLMGAILQEGERLQDDYNLTI